MKNQLASGALVLGLLAMLALCSLAPPRPKKVAVATPIAEIDAEALQRRTAEIVRQSRARIQQRLHSITQEVAELAAEQVEVVDAFFHEAKNNTPLFAEEALGWTSKWRLVRDFLPFGERDGHQRFLREKFEEIVFAPQHLEALVRRAIHRFQTRLLALENQLLVDLQADLEELAQSLPIAGADRALMEHALAQALAQAQGQIDTQLQTDVGLELTALLASEILARVALRLGVSSGILGSGAASGWATLGVGLAAGILVDQLLGWVWDRWADPRGALAKDLDTRLDALRQALVEGDENQLGLRQELHKHGTARIKLWRDALQNLVRGVPP